LQECRQLIQAEILITDWLKRKHECGLGCNVVFDDMPSLNSIVSSTVNGRAVRTITHQIRGVMKTFGLLVLAGKGSTFEKHVRSLFADQNALASIVPPMLEAWRGTRIRAAQLGHQLLRDARQSRACRILMSIPGIGAITATSFTAAEPDNFRK
jgi:transposase